MGAGQRKKKKDTEGETNKSWQRAQKETEVGGSIWFQVLRAAQCVGD